MNTTAPTGLLQQPRPFFMIFFVELWERFGYYGVQGILAVFFVKQLGFSQEQAFITFGAFAALVYGLISIGGYVGDHLLGTKRTLVLGAIVLAIGYFMTGMSLLNPDLIFIALVKTRRRRRVWRVAAPNSPPARSTPCCLRYGAGSRRPVPHAAVCRNLKKSV